MENLNFGQAIEALKQGEKVAREGWNGKGMFIFIRVACYSYNKELHDVVGKECVVRFEKNSEEVGKEAVELLPIIVMKTQDNKVLEGWLPSQTDIFAEDWVILD